LLTSPKVDHVQRQPAFGDQIIETHLARIQPRLRRLRLCLGGIDQPFDKALFGDHEFLDPLVIKGAQRRSSTSMVGASVSGTSAT
jgi:hypothetical protein